MLPSSIDILEIINLISNGGDGTNHLIYLVSCNIFGVTKQSRLLHAAVLAHTHKPVAWSNTKLGETKR